MNEQIEFSSRGFATTRFEHDAGFNKRDGTDAEFIGLPEALGDARGCWFLLKPGDEC
jgi:hypothetical protein